MTVHTDSESPASGPDQIIDPSSRTIAKAVPRSFVARSRIMRSLRRDVLAMISFGLIAIILFAAVFPGVLMTHGPTSISTERTQAPGLTHLMGTDQFGRDTFSRIVSGAQISIVVGVSTVLLAVLLGVPMGALAGYFPSGWIDNSIMRLVDVMMAFPPIILAITVIAALGTSPIDIGPIQIPHIAKLMLVIGVLYAPQVARIVRSAVLVERQEQYVAAELALGTPQATILFVDILRNCLSPVVVHGTLLIANAIIAEAALSFLGLGIQPPDPSWGGMLAEARQYIASGAWWMTVFPGLFIFLTVCALNIIGDFLRDLLDPREFTRQV